MSLLAMKDSVFEWQEGHWIKLQSSSQALQAHAHKFSNPTGDRSELMIRESFVETPAESFTMLCELSSLLNEKGEKSVG